MFVMKTVCPVAVGVGEEIGNGGDRSALTPTLGLATVSRRWRA
jgi:hypothetical protein